jgi:hypothetical protein
MNILIQLIKIKEKLNVSQNFHCIGDVPTNETEYNTNVKWIIDHDENNTPIYGTTQLVTWQQLQENSDEAQINIKLNLVRIERDKRLKETDWWACSDRVMTEPQKIYRQALRDITNNCNPELSDVGDLDLTSVNWPTKPQ